MSNETQRLMEALMLIYGGDLQAATITVLLKDGETAVRFITLTIPQMETSHDQFKPDWDAMAVMVEEQQRMAKRIEELEAMQDAFKSAYIEAKLRSENT